MLVRNASLHNHEKITEGAERASKGAEEAPAKTSSDTKPKHRRRKKKKAKTPPAKASRPVTVVDTSSLPEVDRRTILYTNCVSDEFRGYCLAAVNAAICFTPAQKSYMQAIYNSRLPLWAPQLIVFSNQFHNMMSACRRRTSSEKVYVALINTKEVLERKEWEAVCHFIGKTLYEFTPKAKHPASTKCMTSTELTALSRSCIGMIPYCKNLPKSNIGEFFVPESHKKGKEKLLEWVEVSNAAITDYLRQYSVLSLQLQTRRYKIDPQSLQQLAIRIDYKGLYSLNTLTSCFSLCFLSPKLHAARIAIYRRDMAKKGIFPKVLKEVIIPRIMEVGIEIVSADLKRVFYTTPSEENAIWEMVKIKKPYHEELLDEIMPAISKQQPIAKQFELLMKETIAEAYEAKALSPWTRLIQLYAAVDTLAKNPILLEAAKNAKTGAFTEELLFTFLMQRLTYIKPEHFEGVLNKNKKEMLPEEPTAIAYGAALLAVTEFCHSSYKNCVKDAEEQAYYIIKNTAQLELLARQMQGLGL